MAETGSVIDIEGDKVIVKLQRTEACAKCGACSVGMKTQDMLIKAHNQCDAIIGDEVEIELEESNFIVAVMIMYGLPCVALVLGTVIGMFFTKLIGLSYNELIGFGFGLLCVIITYIWIKNKENYWKSKNFIPKAIKKVN